MTVRLPSFRERRYQAFVTQFQAAHYIQQERQWQPLLRQRGTAVVFGSRDRSVEGAGTQAFIANWETTELVSLVVPFHPKYLLWLFRRVQAAVQFKPPSLLELYYSDIIHSEPAGREICVQHTPKDLSAEMNRWLIDMSETTNEQFLLSRVGLEGESLVVGTITLLVLTAVLLVNGNSVQFSLLAGVVLGVLTAGIRYLVQRKRN